MSRFVRVFRAGFLYPALFLFIIFIATLCFADFKFVVIGDTQGWGGGINKKILNSLMRQVELQQPEFIIFLGDLTSGSRGINTHRKMLLAWKDVVEQYNIPIYVVVGNHDVKTESSVGLVRSIFDIPRNESSDIMELAYSFDYNNAHFVVIDTEAYTSPYRVSDAQLAWLKKDLGKNKKELAFIFGHKPAYPVAFRIGDSLDKYPLERDVLWSVFTELGATAYFCGHEHLYNSSIHDGVYQIITGGGGGFPRVLINKGGFYHFTLVQVRDNGECDITVKNIRGEIKDYFKISSN